jgi:hypothetical protein
MTKLPQLDYLILISLVDDDERFEAVYCHVNNLSYINHDAECNPLYESFFQFPVSWQFQPKEVFDRGERLINDGFIECLITIKNEDGNPSAQRVVKHNSNDFEVFSRYWLSITKKGRVEIDKNIYNDYRDTP